MKSLYTTDIDTHFSLEDSQVTSTKVSTTQRTVRRRVHQRALSIEPLEHRQLLTAGFDDMSPLEQEVATALVATAENQQIQSQIEQQRLMSNAVLDAFFAEFEAELATIEPQTTLDDWFDTTNGQQWLAEIATVAKSNNLTFTGITHAIAQAQAERVQENETPAQTLIADFAIQKSMAERVLQTLPNTEETAELRTQIEALTIPYNRSKAHYIGGNSFTLDIESKTKDITVYMFTENKYSSAPAQIRGVTTTSLQREALSTSHTFSAWLPGSNQVRFLLIDNTTSQKIDEITIPFTGNVASSSNWPELESGLLLEKPITPKLWIQEIKGRNVIVVYQTPYNAGSIGIPGYTQGFETVATQHVGGTLPKATVLTLTNLAPGINTIHLYDAKGNVIASVPLNVTAKYDAARRYTPEYTVSNDHKWNADSYAEKLDAWLPHSKANAVKELYTQELRREQAFVHTVDATFYPMEWGTLYNRMHSAKVGNQYGVLTKQIAPGAHQLAPFYLSNLEYLQQQKATRPDLFTSTGAVQPGKWNAAVMFEQNTNQYYIQYLTKIEGFMSMAAQVLADIANGEPMNSPVQTAYKQYYPTGFTDIRGGYHTQQSMLTSVASILSSSAAESLIEHWRNESDRLHGIQDTKRQEAAEDALYRNQRIMGDLIAKGFMRTAVSNTEHTQNQARAAETFSSSQTSAKAKELATSRNYQRAQRLIAQRLQSSIPATGQYRVVANHTYNSPIIVEDTSTQTAVFTVRTDELTEVAEVMANGNTTIDDVEERVDDLIVELKNSSDTFSVNINSSGVVTYSYFVASNTNVQGVHSVVKNIAPLTELGNQMTSQQLHQLFVNRLTTDFNMIDRGVPLTFGASIPAHITTFANALTKKFEEWRINMLKTNWFKQTESIPGLNFSLQMSTAGKVFAGVLQQFAKGAGEYNIATVVSDFTGIPKAEVIASLPSTQDAAVIANNLKQLFVKHGLGHIFADTLGNPDNMVHHIATSKLNYSLQDSTIRVRFDYFDNSNQAQSVRVYLTNSFGNRIHTVNSVAIAFKTFPLGTTSIQTYIDLPMQDVAKYVKERYGSEVNGVFGIEVALFKGDSEIKVNTQSTIPSVGINTGGSLNIHSDFDLSHRSATEQQAITIALGLNNINTLLDSNGERTSNYFIIKEFYDRHIGPNAVDPLQYEALSGSEFRWRGVTGGTGNLQCKAWLQQDLIKSATGITIGNNTTVENQDATWVDAENDGFYAIEGGRTEAVGQFQNSLQHAKSGDIVQYSSIQTLHTMVISNITSTGIWVFDTNYVGGNTVGLHFMSFTDLNDKIIKATIYRIES